MGGGVPVDSAPENDYVAWAPSDQSRDFNVDRPLPQIQTPATDGRLAGGHSQISQGQLRNTGMNSETGRFTNIDFRKGLFAMGNHATWQLGSGTYTQSLYIEGLSMGDQKQSGRPAPVFSIFNNVGSHVPAQGHPWKCLGRELRRFGYSIKKSRDIRSDPNSKGELVIKNDHLVVEKHQSKPINNIYTWTSVFIVLHVSIPREIPWHLSGVDKICAWHQISHQ